MYQKNSLLKITFWHVLLIGLLIAATTWLWFDKQIHKIDTRIEIMQTQ